MEKKSTDLSNNIIILLRHILAVKNVDHSIEIMKQPSIKRAHIYCKINNIGNGIGTLIENYIKNKYGMIKNKSSLCIGDLQQNQTNFEIKASNGGKNNNKFNYVQLRLNHNCDYILTAYYINYDNVETEGELFIFKLTKPDIKILIFKYGKYAHGTEIANGKITKETLENQTNNNEYSIRPKYGSECWNDLLKFRVQDL